MIRAGMAEQVSVAGARDALNARRATPPLLFLFSLTAILAVGLARVGPRPQLPGGWSVGAALIVAGLVLNVLAARQFKLWNIPIRPGSRSRSLATHGPFRISRNPMYLGMVLVQVGAAVALVAPIGLVAPIVFILLMNKKFIEHEEALLRSEFGQEYSDYSERVRRWI